MERTTNSAHRFKGRLRMFLLAMLVRRRRLFLLTSTTSFCEPD